MRGDVEARLESRGRWRFRPGVFAQSPRPRVELPSALSRCRDGWLLQKRWRGWRGKDRRTMCGGGVAQECSRQDKTAPSRRRTPVDVGLPAGAFGVGQVGRLRAVGAPKVQQMTANLLRTPAQSRAPAARARCRPRGSGGSDQLCRYLRHLGRPAHPKCSE